MAKGEAEENPEDRKGRGECHKKELGEQTGSWEHCACRRFEENAGAKLRTNPPFPR